jgi:hypothetical protein
VVLVANIGIYAYFLCVRSFIERLIVVHGLSEPNKTFKSYQILQDSTS